MMKTLLAFFIFISICSAFDLEPAHPNPGERVTLTGIASPHEQIPFSSSISLNLPVTGGAYEYETFVDISQKPNRFTVTARNVLDFHAGVKIGIWITKDIEPSGGTVSISQANVPPGRYNLKMFGKALPGSTDVPVKVVAETRVVADSTGKYNMVIDTSGLPMGDYVIKGDGDTKTISLGGSPQALSSSGSAAENRIRKIDSENANDEIPLAREKTKQAKITREVVQWYAKEMGMDVKNESQYEVAERLLEKRLLKGYWIVIGQGDPLTEMAGNCEQEYCLVRGVDACTICREKDILSNATKSVSQSNITESMASAVSQDNVEGSSSERGS